MVICCSHGQTEEDNCIDCDRAYYLPHLMMLEMDLRVHSCRLYHILMMIEDEETCHGESDRPVPVVIHP